MRAGPRGLWARSPGGLGPSAWGSSQITIFRKPPGRSLAKASVSAETAASEVGTWRETKPGYSPYPRPRTFWGCKGERKKVFTLSAFGNHPTRPPRSADYYHHYHQQKSIMIARSSRSSSMGSAEVCAKQSQGSSCDSRREPRRALGFRV